MKTIFLTVYDGDTEKVILRSGVLGALTEAGHRVILLIKGEARVPYYRESFNSPNIVVEALPKAYSFGERVWYHIGWNTLPTHSVSVRRAEKFGVHKNVIRYGAELTLGFLGRFRAWRELLRLVYYLTPDAYGAELFERYKPDLVFAPNMFSAEDSRMLRAARHRGIRTVTTTKSWDVLTTKAFTRVRADRIFVPNEINREEAVRIGDYARHKVIVVGFPQFDPYIRTAAAFDREAFLTSLSIDPEKKVILMGIPGDWLTPHTHEILTELDKRIEAGHFSEPLHIIARLHPKYPDTSEQQSYKHVTLDRPGTHFTTQKEMSIDMGVVDSYQWTFTDRDITHLADSIRASEIVINTASTLTLDATAIGKPVILIGYDGKHVLPPEESIARVYRREHYRNVVATNAAPLVRSDEELEEVIKAILQNPEYRSEERALLKEKLLFRVDGQSAKRMAQGVLELL